MSNSFFNHTERKRNHLLCELRVGLHGAFRAGSSAWEKATEQLCMLPLPAGCSYVLKLRWTASRPTHCRASWLHRAIDFSFCRTPSLPHCLVLEDASCWGLGVRWNTKWKLKHSITDATWGGETARAQSHLFLLSLLHLLYPYHRSSAFISLFPQHS